MTSIGLISLLPVGLIFLAMAITGRALPSLLLGVLTSFLLLAIYDEPLQFFWQHDHTIVVLFAVLMTCINAILEKTGAMSAFFSSLERLMSTNKRAQLLTPLLLIPTVVDETNLALRASTRLKNNFRKLNVSREKSSSLIDTIASNGPSILGCTIFFAFLSTLIADALITARLNDNGLRLLLNSIAYHHYAWFSIIIMIITAITGRNFKAMHDAEKNAQLQTIAIAATTTSIPSPQHDLQLTLFYGTIVALFIGGSTVIITTDLILSTKTTMAFLLGASFALFFALTFSIFHRLLEPEDLISACSKNIKNIAPIVAMMLIAWSLSKNLSLLGAPHFLATNVFGYVHPLLMPALIFAIAALFAMFLGINFVTIAVAIPILLTSTLLFWQQENLILVAISSLLGGSIFGGQCAEFYETTSQAIMGARCDGAQHIRCKLVSLLIAATLTIIANTISLITPASISWLIPVGVMVIATIIFLFATTKKPFIPTSMTPIKKTA